MRHILRICNVIYNSSHCIRNCVDVGGHPGSPHFPDHHGWTIEAVQDRLGWSSRVYSLFEPPWMTKSSEQRQNSGAGRVGMTLHATRSECGWRPLGVNSTRNAPKRARIGPGSGRDARKKIHFTLLKMNVDELYHALMLCKVNVEVTLLCVK